MPVFAELPADLDTPLSAYLRLRPGPYSFLLESVEGGEVWARYSFLGTDPLVVLSAKDGRITMRRGRGRPERLPDGGSIPVRRVLPDPELLDRYAADAERTDWWIERLGRVHAALEERSPVE